MTQNDSEDDTYFVWFHDKLLDENSDLVRLFVKTNRSTKNKQYKVSSSCLNVVRKGVPLLFLLFLSWYAFKTLSVSCVYRSLHLKLNAWMLTNFQVESDTFKSTSRVTTSSESSFKTQHLQADQFWCNEPSECRELSILLIVEVFEEWFSWEKTSLRWHRN